MLRLGSGADEARIECGWATGAEVSSAERLDSAGSCAEASTPGLERQHRSVGKLEAQLRRVPDCELMFLARVLGVSISDLFPKGAPLRQLGPQFQSGQRLAIFPARGER